MTIKAKMKDRRVVRTRQALRGALLDLLGSGGWDAVTVQALCRGADIGRSTFYQHFQGKEELLVASLDELRQGLLAAHRVPVDAGGVSREACSSLAPFVFLPGLLAHMAEQRAVFRAVIGRRSGRVIEARFQEMVRQLVLAVLPSGRAEREVEASFIAGGWVALMAWWIEQPSPPPLAKLERMLWQLGVAAGTWAEV